MSAGISATHCNSIIKPVFNSLPFRNISFGYGLCSDSIKLQPPPLPESTIIIRSFVGHFVLCRTYSSMRSASSVIISNPSHLYFLDHLPLHTYTITRFFSHTMPRPIFLNSNDYKNPRSFLPAQIFEQQGSSQAKIMQFGLYMFMR